MGSIGNGPRLAAFQSDVFASGLDLRRSQMDRDLGMFKAAESASFEAGMMVSLNSSQEIVKADGADVLGVAKWNKVSLGTSTIMDEEVVVVAGGVSQLRHANVKNLTVRTAADFGGITIASAGNFTLSTTNGTLTWAAVPLSVINGQKVFVSYTFAMTESDYRLQGKNFFGSVDDVSIAEGRVTVVMAPAMIFTTQFDSSRVYSLTGAGSNLYCGGLTAGLEGLFTNDSAEGPYVGRVIQLPSASDPFLGINFSNLPEEA